MFISPLFDKTAIEEELKAIDQEHAKNLGMIERQVNQVLKTELAIKGSMLDHFSTGNLETLNKPDLREHIVKFFEERYSSNVMTLALSGSFSLDELQALAVAKFSKIKNKNILLPMPSLTPAPLYDQSALGHFVYINPKESVKTLKLLWPQLPSSIRHLESRLLSFLSHNLGHEGKNSLLSELIKQDLATSCNAGSEWVCNMEYQAFKISMNLTDKGAKNLELVLRITFA
jgi:insulysin